MATAPSIFPVFTAPQYTSYHQPSPYFLPTYSGGHYGAPPIYPYPPTTAAYAHPTGSFPAPEYGSATFDLSPHISVGAPDPFPFTPTFINAITDHNPLSLEFSLTYTPPPAPAYAPAPAPLANAPSWGLDPSTQQTSSISLSSTASPNRERQLPQSHHHTPDLLHPRPTASDTFHRPVYWMQPDHTSTTLDDHASFLKLHDSEADAVQHHATAKLGVSVPLTKHASLLTLRDSVVDANLLLDQHDESINRIQGQLAELIEMVSKLVVY